MPWGRLDDSLYDHPKVDALPSRVRNACVGLWVRAISWSNRYLTDGAVPTDRLRKLDGRKAEVDALVVVGLFDRTSAGVAIHDFLTFNESAEDVRNKRAEMRELGKRGGQASGLARRFNRNGSTVDEAGRVELPSSPVPSDSSPHPAKRGRRNDGTSPRQEGTNPRASGTSPRQVKAAEKRAGLPEAVGAVLREALEGKQQ